MAEAPPRPGPAPPRSRAPRCVRPAVPVRQRAGPRPPPPPARVPSAAAVEVAPRPGEVSEALQPALPHPPPAWAAGSGCPAAAPTDAKHGKVSPLHAPGPPCRAPRAAGAALGGDGRGGIVAGETGAILGRSVAWRPRAGPPRCEGPHEPPAGPAGTGRFCPRGRPGQGSPRPQLAAWGPPRAPGVNSKSGAGGAAQLGLLPAGRGSAARASPKPEPPARAECRRSPARDAGRSGCSGSCSAAFGTRLHPWPGTTAARRRELLAGWHRRYCPSLGGACAFSWHRGQRWLLSLKMAELFMECEEEELEPWQKRVREVEEDDEDDDDEPIFVGEISSSKPATTCTVTTFKSENQHYMTPASSPGALPAPSVFQTVPRPATSSVAVQPLAVAVNVSGTSQTLQRPVAGCLSTQQVPGSSSGIAQPVSRPVTIPVTTQPVSRNITVPVVAQPVSRPETPATAQPVILNQDYIMDSPPDAPDNTSGILFGVRQNSGVPQYQTGPAVNVTGTNAASSTIKNGGPFPRACPKCNIHFNLMDPLKNHMKNSFCTEYIN